MILLTFFACNISERMQRWCSTWCACSVIVFILALITLGFAARMQMDDICSCDSIAEACDHPGGSCYPLYMCDCGEVLTKDNTCVPICASDQKAGNHSSECVVVPMDLANTPCPSLNPIYPMEQIRNNPHTLILALCCIVLFMTVVNALCAFCDLCKTNANTAKKPTAFTTLYEQRPPTHGTPLLSDQLVDPTARITDDHL